LGKGLPPKAPQLNKGKEDFKENLNWWPQIKGFKDSSPEIF